MSVLNENTIIGASAAGEYEIEQSLRFNDDDSAYLSRTPSSAGNQKTWTWSGWVKRGNLGSSTYYCFYGVDGVSPNDRTEFVFTADAFEIYEEVSSTAKISLKTTQLFRDPSAWYHVVIAMDTTQATNTNRVKFYVNGEQVTSFSASTYPSLNYDTFTNSAKVHVLGARRYADGTTNKFLDGYLAEVNLIDGLALTPDSFGETGDYGEWKPLKYTGAYGTNGFYLPFEQDYTVEGFSTVTYEGNGSGQYIGGVGFQPDLTWFKCRSDSSSSAINDSIRGRIPILTSNTTAAEVGGIASDDDLISWETDGFLLGHNDSANSHGRNNVNARTYVAWNWDMGGTTASNTSGSITSSVRANTTYGQSIVRATYSGSGTQTFGHGLGAAPDLILGKAEDHAYGWGVYHSGLSSPETKSLALNTTAAATTNNKWANTLPTSSVFSATIGGLEDAGYPVIFYCFSSVTGYSKFGSYSGNGSSTGPVVTLGFSPAFVMIKRTNAVDNWIMMDNTRDPYNPADKWLYPSGSFEEYDGAARELDFLANGFQPKAATTEFNASGSTYIYAAFADNREYAYWYDQSGNNNDWTSEGGLTESDVMVDSPTNNFCTLNPLDMNIDSYAITVSEGNLQAAGPSEGRNIRSTMGMPTGKWYWETCTTVSGIYNVAGIAKNSSPLNGVFGQDANGYTMFGQNGDKFNNNSTSSYGSAWNTVGDICGVAFDADNGTLVFYVNNSSQGTAFTGLTSGDFFPALAVRTGTAVMNFGQDSSFAGNKTAQGNQDSNDIGDFYYAPPAGFLALCTSNLPSVDVIPSEHFNTVTYTGDGSADQSMTGVGFQPDFLWLKRRNAAERHVLTNILYTYDNGAYKWNDSSDTKVEFGGGTGIASFDSDGFSIKTSDTTWNANGSTYVAWNWKAAGSASSNTNGSITSSVSANVEAGFSIVSYTGNGANATVGHGLSVAPNMTWIKPRNFEDNWIVTYDAVDGSDDQIYLNLTNAGGSPATQYAVAQNATTLGLTSWNNVNDANDTYIAYCFNSVDGHSRVGSYIGNGNADGPFVHCGFKPKFIILKPSSFADGWRIMDSTRSPSNVMDKQLFPHSSSAEATSSSYYADFVSNGFKLRSSHGGFNQSGETFIFLAFAENPFKHTNAR